MKKIILMLTLSLFCASAYARTVTAEHHTSKPSCTAEDFRYAWEDAQDQVDSGCRNSSHRRGYISGSGFVEVCYPESEGARAVVNAVYACFPIK